MLRHLNLLPGKARYLYGLILLLFIAVAGVAFSMANDGEFNTARREILMRKIGDQVLLQSGDSTSRVLPVKKIAENEYQIRFEKELTFETDSLVNSTRRLLAEDPQITDYVVNVLNCANASITYGYAMAENKKDDIVTCLGRKQPVGCYMINIRFKTAPALTVRSEYALGAISLLAFVGLLFLRPFKMKKVIPGIQFVDPDTSNTFTLGAMIFSPDTRKLMIDEKSIDLTKTETRVLRIFALSPNEAVERSRLQKEIWEDEGVIVGRSLDMFISKLRKKLEADPAVKIVVIRGKGYKLEIAG